jgi:chromosomal replication initiation ATPase DnaA
MENLKNYRNIKHYIEVKQAEKLEKIIAVILTDLNITNEQLMAKTKFRPVTEARRRIAYIGRLLLNAQGNLIAKRLELQKEQVSQIIYSTFGICQVEPEYKDEINALINRIESNGIN